MLDITSDVFRRSAPRLRYLKRIAWKASRFVTQRTVRPSRARKSQPPGENGMMCCLSTKCALPYGARRSAIRTIWPEPAEKLTSSNPPLSVVELTNRTFDLKSDVANICRTRPGVVITTISEAEAPAFAHLFQLVWSWF